VLLVDEDEETLDRLEAELRGSCSVIRAGRGREGVELAREHRPDLVLLDLVGGEMSGLEVVATLKSEPRTREIPILGMTASDLSEADKARLNGRVDAVLTKGEEASRHLLQRLRLLENRLAGDSGVQRVSSQSNS
jgi:two-component system alkaline phosphatase synthesis response regulator PhoP